MENHRLSWVRLLSTMLASLPFVWLGSANLAAQERLGQPRPVVTAPEGFVHLTLADAKQRVLANSKLLGLASMNVAGKEIATRVLQADYYPQILGNTFYMHFDEPLGDVLTHRRLLGQPPVTVDAFVLNQNSQFSTVYAAQPITALLKIRQGVTIARADEEIARTDVEKATRALVSGVEQLYWGWLAAERIRSGAIEALQGAEMLARTGLPEAKVALVEARQGLQEVENQLADVEAQLSDLLGFPTGTKFQLVEPPMPAPPVRSAEDVAAAAAANSPEVRAAEQDVVKAHAAVAAAKVDYLPNIAVVGGYANQTFADYMQQNFEYMGVVGSYTFFNWGKRRNTVRERENLVAMAQLKVAQTVDEVRQKAQKAYREFDQHRNALKTAEEMVQAREEAAKAARTPEAMQNPGPLIEATKKLGLAEVDLIKADLAYRISATQLMSLIGAH
jgi:outer membrane protein TolC